MLTFPSAVILSWGFVGVGVLALVGVAFAFVGVWDALVTVTLTFCPPLVAEAACVACCVGSGVNVGSSVFVGVGVHFDLPDGEPLIAQLPNSKATITSAENSAIRRKRPIFHFLLGSHDLTAGSISFPSADCNARRAHRPGIISTGCCRVRLSRFSSSSAPGSASSATGEGLPERIADREALLLRHLPSML